MRSSAWSACHFFLKHVSAPKMCSSAPETIVYC
jgi:hypothetical protein